jgi:hypothetical protein
VALFASLFRGRADVFATRWESARSRGKTGWAPRCSNEWRPGLCAKPKVRCADCANRRCVPWSEAEARRHLEGRQTAGIYPLLADETCWLVAIDLDGPTWREDVDALRDITVGHRETIELLLDLDRGAPLSAPDSLQDATPLGWARHNRCTLLRAR